jgi:Ser/Thr protein kinase RdoA (MazF antagonist)
VTQYGELSRTGKLRRLRALAEKALACYELDDPGVRFHGYETNLLYRVTERSGRRLMARLASPEWRTLVDLQSEAMWLNALSRDTSIPVPRVLPNRSGAMVTTATAAGVPVPWNVSLMTWVPGRSLGRYLSEGNLEKMGALFAALHGHGASWKRPPGFTTRRFEHWLSRGEPNLIITSDAPPILHRMHEAVEAAYARIDRGDLRVIHCDLWHENIRLHRGRLCPFDFEDTILGFRAHDIAMGMLDLLEETGDDEYPRLLAAFRRGYEACEKWPTDPIEPLQIGRLLWTLNWVARNQPKWTNYAIERHMPVFEEFERSGRVIARARSA